jgi:hypothetical protein
VKGTNDRHVWTSADEETLATLLRASHTIPEIAQQMGRSQEAVRGRASKAGLRKRRRTKSAADQPGPAKNVGDPTANPLPDDTKEGPEAGGDPGRT